MSSQCLELQIFDSTDLNRKNRTRASIWISQTTREKYSEWANKKMTGRREIRRSWRASNDAKSRATVERARGAIDERSDRIDGNDLPAESRLRENSTSIARHTFLVRSRGSQPCTIYRYLQRSRFCDTKDVREYLTTWRVSLYNDRYFENLLNM